MPGMKMPGNFFLVGLMGAGKTTVGRQLARRLGRRFYDSDHEIVARTGVPIPTIFEIEGEAGFRRRESQTIAELSELRGIVMATGGGAVLATVVFVGGIAPLAGASLLFVTGNAWWVIAIYSAVLSLISFLTTFVTPETKGRSLTDLNDAGQETVHV